jgi:hypothetical protein
MCACVAPSQWIFVFHALQIFLDQTCSQGMLLQQQLRQVSTLEAC